LIAEGACRLKFEGVVTRRMTTEPVHLVGAYRRNNDNPVLDLFKQHVLPAFLQA
ncbi:MAG TPA: LysR family transcriptional regulator, partial [Massilia timonae]|nr:LysR family transcriptional regulator [Massilia timonae]